MAGTVIKAIPLSTLSTAALQPVVYTAINVPNPLLPFGLPEACFDIFIYNVSTATVFISYEGVVDEQVILPNTVFTLPGSYSAQPSERYALWQKGQIFYARSATAPVGNLYLSGYYVK
jgi:hypothetical protein